MYERSAIILEKYYNDMFGLNKNINLRTNLKNYKNLVEETVKCQDIFREEEKIINEFDEVANDIRNIQAKQKELNKSNNILEEQRNQLFQILDDEPENIKEKIDSIEKNLEDNDAQLVVLKDKFVEDLKIFNQKQKERNQCSRKKRTEENEFMQYSEKSKRDLEKIELEVISELKEYISTEDDSALENEIFELMMNNGKDERIEFSRNVMKSAISARNTIEKNEASCYISTYEKMSKLLNDIEKYEDIEAISIDKYLKVLKEVEVKLEFLKSVKNYIINLLDYERMTVINGKKIHTKMMEEACNDFSLDMKQIMNLYDLVQKETSRGATKKNYEELYNKEYLKNIEEKERNFEKEANNIKIKTGTLMNSNFWRIDGIKNIYQTFQNEISSKYGKDLSEYVIEEIDDEDDDISDIDEEKQNENDMIFNQVIQSSNNSKKEDLDDSSESSNKEDDENNNEIVGYFYDDEEHSSNNNGEDDYDYVDKEDAPDADIEEYLDDDDDDEIYDEVDDLDEEKNKVNNNQKNSEINDDKKDDEFIENNDISDDEDEIEEYFDDDDDDETYDDEDFKIDDSDIMKNYNTNSEIKNVNFKLNKEKKANQGGIFNKFFKDKKK